MGQRRREMPPLPDVPAILETLVRQKVMFVVIGGVAVAHHGYVRATADVDVVPEPGEEQLRRLWGSLQEMDAEPLAVGDPRPEELPAPLDLEGLLGGGNWDLATRFGRLDMSPAATRT